LDLVFFLGVPHIAIWGTTLLRGADAMIEGASYLPVARYAYPAIIPTMLVLIVGWLGISHLFSPRIRIPDYAIAGIIIGFFIAVDVLSIITLNKYYP